VNRFDPYGPQEEQIFPPLFESFLASHGLTLKGVGQGLFVISVRLLHFFTYYLLIPLLSRLSFRLLLWSALLSVSVHHSAFRKSPGLPQNPSLPAQAPNSSNSIFCLVKETRSRRTFIKYHETPRCVVLKCLDHCVTPPLHVYTLRHDGPRFHTIAIFNNRRNMNEQTTVEAAAACPAAE
jgi:hypothetical protein